MTEKNESRPVSAATGWRALRRYVALEHGIARWAERRPGQRDENRSVVFVDDRQLRLGRAGEQASAGRALGDRFRCGAFRFARGRLAASIWRRDAFF